MTLTYTDIVHLVKGVNFELRRTSKHVAVLMNASKVEQIFTNRYAVHAEELAVAHFVANNRRIRRPRIYITRLSLVNNMSRPCRHCCGLLKRFPQIRVFYTDKQGDWIEEMDFDACHISHRRKECGFCLF
jgi:cytidine deaminase